MNQTESKDILLSALAKLDDRLANMGYTSLDIKIVGGSVFVHSILRPEPLV